MPHWALGWNQCKWGYTSTQDLKNSVGNYSEFGIPLDTQWTDIDYMKVYEDFTFDDNNFNGLPDFITDLHSKNMKFISIIDAGVAKRDDYPMYTDGVEQDVFIKSGKGDEASVGQVWPGDAVFPDWFANNTADWWHMYMDQFFQ